MNTRQTYADTDYKRNTASLKQNHRETASLKGIWFLMAIIFFIMVFCYMSLNLKNVDYGYQIQELENKQTELQEEINALKSEKASLLNLNRVEKNVMDSLGYQYPTRDQFIQVQEDE